MKKLTWKKKKKQKLGLCSDGVVRKYKNQKGENKVVGGERLKESGQYPLKFCRTVAKWHTKHVVPGT